MHKRGSQRIVRARWLLVVAALLGAVLALPSTANAAIVGTISGRVTNPSGDGIPDVWVTTVNTVNYATEYYGETYTDTNGYYTVPVYDGDPVELVVMFETWMTNELHSTDYVGEFYNDTQAVLSAVKVGAGATNIDAQLAIGGSISGKVYGPDGVTPVKDIEVEYRVGSPFQPWAFTEADGSYILRGAPAASALVAAIPDYYNTTYGGHYTEVRRNLTVTSGGLASGIDLVLGGTGPAPTLTPIYRFYRPATGTHFYTMDENEMIRVRDTMKATYSLDGIGYYINLANAANSVPLYRYFNTRTGTHLYTADAREMASLPAWYQCDGIAYYVSFTTGTQVHRFYSPTKGVHFYSANPEEIAYVRANLGATWQYEGPAYCVGQ